MIFVTVGDQLPFDRLLSYVIDWADKNIYTDIFIQGGNTLYQSSNVKIVNFLSPSDYQKRIKQAEFVISHVGMGTIITAMEYGKQLLMMPRDPSLGECVNDHQFTSAKRFSSFPHINIAFDEEEFNSKLKILLNKSEKTMLNKIGPTASPKLIQAIKEFIHVRSF